MATTVTLTPDTGTAIIRRGSTRVDITLTSGAADVTIRRGILGHVTITVHPVGLQRTTGVVRDSRQPGELSYITDDRAAFSQATDVAAEFHATVAESYAAPWPAGMTPCEAWEDNLQSSACSAPRTCRCGR
jgi:hypothetical protein